MRFGPFSFIFLAAFGFLLLEPNHARAADPGCWDPSQEPEIAKLFEVKPNSKYKKAEDAKTIELIHDTIWSHREDLDPRLVYHRMIGEAMGDPWAGTTYYGLFQFGGAHKTAVKALERKNPNVSPRLLQVQYYFDTYVKKFKEDVNRNNGCLPSKKWASYTNLEKSVYLNQGSCNAGRLAHERSYCTPKSPNQNYRLHACKFSLAATNGRAKRICERQNPGTRPARPAVPLRAPAKSGSSK